VAFLLASSIGLRARLAIRFLVPGWTPDFLHNLYESESLLLLRNNFSNFEVVDRYVDPLFKRLSGMRDAQVEVRSNCSYPESIPGRWLSSLALRCGDDGMDIGTIEITWKCKLNQTMHGQMVHAAEP